MNDLYGKVEHGVDKRGVKGDAGDHRFREQHDQRPGELLGHDGLDVQFDFFLGMVIAHIPGLLSEADCLPLKQDRTICLGQANERDGNDGEVHNHLDVLCPPPPQLGGH